MLLKLKRNWFSATEIIGLLYAYNDGDLDNSLLRVFSLEDIERPVKIKGQTAIPVGRYEIEWAWSPHFKKQVLMLKDVPNFDRIYLHAGTKHEDTEGCILLGIIKSGNRLVRSEPAVAAVYQLVGDALARKEEVLIEITH